MVALLDLRPNWISSQGNFVSLEHLSVTQQLKRTFPLENNHAVGLGSLQWLACRSRQHKPNHRADEGSHRRIIAPVTPLTVLG